MRLLGAAFNAATYVVTTDNFTLGGLAREAIVGAGVGALTAVVPGAIAIRKLNFGGPLRNLSAGLGAAAAASAVGSLVNQSLQYINQSITAMLQLRVELLLSAWVQAALLLGPAKSIDYAYTRSFKCYHFTSPTGKTIRFV